MLDLLKQLASYGVQPAIIAVLILWNIYLQARRDRDHDGHYKDLRDMSDTLIEQQNQIHLSIGKLQAYTEFVEDEREVWVQRVEQASMDPVLPEKTPVAPGASSA